MRARVADLSRLDGQIPEVSHGSWFKPQCHAAARVCTRFDVVDDQSRLFVAVNIEPCPFAVHLDPDLRPLSGDEIDWVRVVDNADRFPTA
jgi:hypothetical protein